MVSCHFYVVFVHSCSVFVPDSVLGFINVSAECVTSSLWEQSVFILNRQALHQGSGSEIILGGSLCTLGQGCRTYSPGAEIGPLKYT